MMKLRFTDFFVIIFNSLKIDSTKYVYDCVKKSVIHF